MNWELLLRAIVPIGIAAIWILTALFNRESQGFPPRAGAPPSTLGPRPGDPTLRWGSPPSTPPRAPTARRVPLGEDDILIIQNDPARPARPPQSRPMPSGSLRRGTKARPAAATAPPRVEPPAPRSKLAGVSQIVNQQLANPAALTPLTSIAPMTTATGNDLANAPSAPSKTSAVLTVSTLIPLMNDPLRLRESFVVNELFQPPLALRGRRTARR